MLYECYIKNNFGYTFLSNYLQGKYNQSKKYHFW